MLKKMLERPAIRDKDINKKDDTIQVIRNLKVLQGKPTS